ncbi:unnamed protein product [Thlaspi arvense]|uniref:KIB1-4 beta-propeller domain-containing protein n=1 Tax=Thlaspi arvense TaxID=13288 RepID=A0AAU9R6F4_THLAR|nr:unnamed protein product [Thlaspi arvense]
MSRLLSKLSPLINKSRSVRLFSSSKTGPCISICSVVEPSPDGRGDIGEVLLFDVSKFELVRAVKTFPDEFQEAALVGASHGWGFFSNREDRSVFISDFLNPYASKTEPKMIPLPPFTTRFGCQTEVVCNVAMSSPPEPYDKDWAVGVKFLGKQLSFCRPHCDMRWTNIQTPFESWDTSKLMYSKKDERFYLLAPGGKYLCSWDLNFKKDKKPKFHELVLHDVPEMTSSVWKHMESFFREDHWVESPSGESFLVKWFYEYTTEGFKTPTALVFREEDTVCGKKNMRYTKDIGDLCIFISQGDDFCVEASSCNLHPNSVVLNGRVFALVDIGKRRYSYYEYPEGTPGRIPHSPYWLPPFSS